jgi:DUF4097 and DUF4098 domain-containing protein YvlB
MIHLILAGAMAMAMPQQRTDTTFAVRTGGRLVVDNYGGSVTVRSWARNEMRVQATHNSRTEVEIDRSATTVSIDASTRNGPAEVNYVINVPRSFRVSIDGVNTDADVDGIEGDVDVSTVEGNVTVRNVVGRVAAESVSGWVVVQGVRGRVSASSTNQSMRLSDITGDVEAEAVNGSISLLGIESSSVAAETVNGSIVLGSTIRDGGSYALSTTNGSLTIGIPEGTNASFEAETFSGKLDTSFPMTLDKKRSGSYQFRIGNGSAHISLESFAGTIRLVRPSELRDISTGKGKNK